MEKGTGTFSAQADFETTVKLFFAPLPVFLLAALWLGSVVAGAQTVHEKMQEGLLDFDERDSQDSPAKADETVEKEVPEQQTERQDEEEEEEKKPFDMYWDEGLYISGLWENVRVKIGGDIQNDTAGFANTDSAAALLDTDIDGGVEWRRVRGYIEGAIHRNIEFKLRYDFSVSNPPNLKDAFINLVNLPLPLEITVGRFRAPLGLDGYTGADDTVFLERSTMSSAFLPSRNTGVLLHGETPRVA